MTASESEHQTHMLLGLVAPAQPQLRDRPIIILFCFVLKSHWYGARAMRGFNEANRVGR